MRRTVLAIIAAAALALTACGDDDDAADTGDTGDTGDTAATAGTAGTGGAGPATAATTGGGDITAAAGATTADADVDAVNPEAAACAEGRTLTEGRLTVATGEPAFPPYVLDDDPASGQGFEAAVAYAVAAQMGFAEDEVTWVRTAFDNAIAPGPKDFDFNLQQFAISAQRSEVVTFSIPYYTTNQAILGYADSPAADAADLSALQDLQIGVVEGTTGLDFVEQVLQPTAAPSVYNDTAAAKQALDTRQIDAIVADLPTAFFMAAVEIEGAQVFGQFPAVEGSEGESWGLLFAKDNPLVECADLALSALTASGELEAITDEWMSESAGVPEISLE